MVEREPTTRAVPYSVEVADRIPKERYYDPEFFQLEVEHLWPRVWQMACRLEEIPNPNDYAVYENLGQSVVVVRTADGGVEAFANSCRHRGVQVAAGRGSCAQGFVCPFHGWCYGPDGRNTYISKRSSFSAHNLDPDDVSLVPIRAEAWGGCAFINHDADAPPLRECIEPFASTLDAWHVDQLRAEWWYAFRLPVNWKLAEAAFLEQYHVIESHPQLVIPDRYPPRDPAAFDPQVFLRGELHYLRMMSEGMAGMVHARDVAIAERLAAEIELPADPELAVSTWNRRYNEAVTTWHRAAGHVVPDINELDDTGLNQPMGYCFPHYYVLPMYSSASSYRFRPLGPEETLMEIWSLTRYPEGSEPDTPPIPTPIEYDDPGVPPIPAQDFSNLPKQQRGLHNQSFEYLRLAEKMEGGVGNMERTVDGFLAGRPWEQLLHALRQVNVNPLEQPIRDLGF